MTRKQTIQAGAVGAVLPLLRSSAAVDIELVSVTLYNLVCVRSALTWDSVSTSEGLVAFLALDAIGGNEGRGGRLQPWLRSLRMKRSENESQG